MEALGAKKITEMHTNEFNKILNKRRADLINECGGEESWDALIAEEQTAKLAELLQDVSIQIERTHGMISHMKGKKKCLNFFGLDVECTKT